MKIKGSARGVQLGNDHPLDGRNPAALGNMPLSNIYSSRD
jgi:hypothetical protein